jgi:hypothetical protein
LKLIVNDDAARMKITMSILREMRIISTRAAGVLFDGRGSSTPETWVPIRDKSLCLR